MGLIKYLQMFCTTTRKSKVTLANALGMAVHYICQGVVCTLRRTDYCKCHDYLRREAIDY